jgi:N-formylglutamate deformylase
MSTPDWSVFDVGTSPSPLVIHVPHSGTEIPDAERLHLLLDDEELELEIGRMTDWFTDTIAADAVNASGVSTSVFVNNVSRLIVDPERFLDDTEPMTAIGMGAVYRVTSQLRDLRHPDENEEKRLLDEWFHPYAAAFAELIEQKLRDHGEAIIVDLHSFPEFPLPYELDQEVVRPGICLGTDEFHTPKELREAAVAAFVGISGGVDENRPFSGTYVPLSHWRRTSAITSIMIEVRRDLYQAQPGGYVNSGYPVLTGHLAAFLSGIVSS